MSEVPEADGRSPDDDRVDVDDPFEITEDVAEQWEDEGDVAEGEAPSG